MTDEPADDDLSAIYRNRFDERELANKRVLWRVLVDDFFQRYVPARRNRGRPRRRQLRVRQRGRRASDGSPSTSTPTPSGTPSPASRC